MSGRILAAVACAAALCFGHPPSARAQQNTPTAPAAKAVSEFDAIRAAAEREVNRGSGANVLPPELLAEDQKSYAAHLQWQRQFARESWEWHLFSTRLLMVVVLVIVACGLWFTYIQFTKDAGSSGAKRPGGTATDPANDPAAETAGEPKPTTVKIGPGGLEVTSQVIGLLVLGFSLAFFYLYVKEVYPMQESQLRSQAEAAAAPAASQAKR